MKVAEIDMRDRFQYCPCGFTLRTTPRRVCQRLSSGCTSIQFLTYGVRYSKVCGRVKAYQYGTTRAFYMFSSNNRYGNTIDGYYVDGISITHGAPRQHIWTFAAAYDETRSDGYTCPCTDTSTTYTGRVPPFVGNDSFCDTGSHSRAYSGRFYQDDPLWDGHGCGPTSTCCKENTPPWFCKELPEATVDDIEVRVCSASSAWDTPFAQIELYVQ